MWLLLYGFPSVPGSGEKFVSLFPSHTMAGQGFPSGSSMRFSCGGGGTCLFFNTSCGCDGGFGGFGVGLAGVHYSAVPNVTFVNFEPQVSTSQNLICDGRVALLVKDL